MEQTGGTRTFNEEAQMIDQVYRLLKNKHGHVVYANTGQPYTMKGRLVDVTESTITLVNKAGEHILVRLSKLHDVKVSNYVEEVPEEEQVYDREYDRDRRVR